MISLMWFPPILLFTYRYVKGGQLRQILYAGACYGGLILTHLLNAYMFTFVLAAFIITMSIAEGKTKRLIALPLIGITGLLISAAYILPLIYEKRFVNLNAFVGEGVASASRIISYYRTGRVRYYGLSGMSITTHLSFMLRSSGFSCRCFFFRQ